MGCQTQSRHPALRRRYPGATRNDAFETPQGSEDTLPRVPNPRRSGATRNGIHHKPRQGLPTRLQLSAAPAAQLQAQAFISGLHPPLLVARPSSPAVVSHAIVSGVAISPVPGAFRMSSISRACRADHRSLAIRTIFGRDSRFPTREPMKPRGTHHRILGSLTGLPGSGPSRFLLPPCPHGHLLAYAHGVTSGFWVRPQSPVVPVPHSALDSSRVCVQPRRLRTQRSSTDDR
jgi:hypothetical protein